MRVLDGWLSAPVVIMNCYMVVPVRIYVDSHEACADGGELW